MMTTSKVGGGRIRYGWHPMEGPAYPDGPGRAHVYHVSCAPRSFIWLSCEANEAHASNIEKGHPTCDGCGLPFKGVN